MANVQNVVAVPITPEQPKTVANQQLFVYINKDLTGGRYFSGSAITGTSTTPTAYETGITEAIVGDVYINTYGQMYVCTLSGDDDTALWVYSGVTIAGSKWYFGWGVYGQSSTPLTFSTSGVTYANAGDVYMNTDQTEDRGNLYECVTPGDANTATWKYIDNVSVIGHNVSIGDASINITAEPYRQYTFKTPTNSITIGLPSVSTMYNGYISEVDFVTDNNPSLTLVTNGNTVKYFVRGTIVNTYTPSANKEINMLFRYNGESMLCVVLEI